MPSKTYRIFLKSHYAISVSIQMANGRVVSFVVRLIDTKGDEERDLARYDTAHGWPHLDILTRSGNLKTKHWMRASTLEEALNDAIEDFKRNYENYRHNY